MPKILIITIVHLLFAVVSGLFIGLVVFGVGFSDSASTKEIYGWLVQAWKIFDYPASYILDHPNSNGFLFIGIQLVTSFVWANIYAFSWSYLSDKSSD